MNDSTFIILNYLFQVFIFTITFSITPYIIKRTISFGIRIPENEYNNDKVKKIRNRYRNIIITSGILFVLLILIAFKYFNLIDKDINTIYLVITISLLTIFFTTYIISHYSMKKLKTNSNWIINNNNKITIDTTFRKRKLAVSKWWFFTYVIIILITTFVPIILYDKLPSQLPTHFDISGNADMWTVKSRAIWYIPISQIFNLIIMLFVYFIIKKSKQDISTNDPVNSSKNSVRYRYIMSRLIVFSGLLLQVGFLTNQLYIIGILTNKLWIVLMPLLTTLTVIILVIVIIYKIGQGGWKISKQKKGTSGEIDREDDKFWKLGSFYFNPNDPAVFIEKRFGIGWTINFARPESWLTLIGFVIIIIIFGKII